MKNANPWLAKASLWSSIIGLVLPGCFVFFDFAYLQKHMRNEQDLGLEISGYIISGFLFVTLELSALGCGFAARRSATGKAGLIISGAITILVFFFYLVAWIRFGSSTPDPSPPPSAAPTSSVPPTQLPCFRPLSFSGLATKACSAAMAV